MTRRSSELPRVLLLQIRREPSVRQEERRSFERHSALPAAQIDVLNVFDQPDFGPGVVSGYDALFIGGASEASVLEPDRYPFVTNGQDLIRHCLEIDLPVFASCFGFQLAVLALGGEVERDGEDFEMGTLPIALTPEAAADPLFGGFPGEAREFLAVSVHQEKTTAVPDNCTPLARTGRCLHAFRPEGKPFWAFQFHPEVDRETLVSRLTVYRKRYTDDTAHLNRIIDSAMETPIANALLRRFVERVVLGK